MDWKLRDACKRMLTMHIIGLAIVGVTFLFTTDVFGGQIDLLVGSKHSQDTYVSTHTHNGICVKETEHKYNESNPGIAYTTDSGWVVGIYDNSYNKTTVFGGRVFETKAKYLNVGVALGAATGYEITTGMVITPTAMPYVMIGPKPIRAKIGVIPGKVNALTFMININY